MIRLREKTNEQLKLLLIETYLRCGTKSEEYRAVREALYARGFTQEEVVTLLVAGEIYHDVNRFYEKHAPQLN